MLKHRVIPILLYKNGGLYKTIQFKKPKYVGDPINAIKIFNEKDADELIFIDIQASKENNEPNYHIINDIASECFMPLCYGGGIKNIEQIKRIFAIGVEKISINYNCLQNLLLIEEAAKQYGSQSIVMAIDIKKNLFGKYTVYDHVKGKNTTIDPVQFAWDGENAGAGELLITSVDKEGTMNGYDLKLMSLFSEELKIPIIANGGAGTIEHFKEVIQTSEVSAVAAGCLFVFQGKHRAVLISYPKYNELQNLLNE